MKFKILAEYFDKIENASSRLKMTDHLAELFKKSDIDEIDKIIYLCQGSIAPRFKGIDLGIGEKFVIRAIALATGNETRLIETKFKKSGDLGDVASELLSKKRQDFLFSNELTVSKVFDNFIKLANIGGEGSQDSKIKLIAELLSSANSLEARYICRFPVGKLRLGIGDPTILDALSVYEKGSKEMREEIERAFNLTSDLGYIAKIFIEDPKKLKKIKPIPFSPIRPSLAERMSSAEEIFKKLGKCFCDSKYDGLRMAVHKKEDKVEIYSRNQERITKMFPDIVEEIKKIKAESIIFEGEALAYDEKNEKYYSFQETIRRKRKYDIKKMKEQFPIEVFAFDLLYLNGKDYTQEPFNKRRKELEKIIPKKNKILKTSNGIIANSSKDIEKFYNTCLKHGLEGIIAKDLEAEYIAGARKFSWIKLKKSYGKVADTFDVVIVGYYLGKGHRAQFNFGGLLTAVYNDEKDRYETIARIGSGFSEEEMETFEKELSKIKLNEKPKELDSEIKPDFWVNLKYVITVSADEISLSPLHTCAKDSNTDKKGFALRFPRMIEIREDKDPKDATTTKEIKEMYRMQKN
ncbi:MAG: ATP-dependent DNA ligase [Candidatus Micrarchaeia archaeon]|jgi:DNA ligase-1